MVCIEYFTTERYLWFTQQCTKKISVFYAFDAKGRLFSPKPGLILEIEKERERERGRQRHWREGGQIKRTLVKTKQFLFKSQTGNQICMNTPEVTYSSKRQVEICCDAVFSKKCRKLIFQPLLKIRSHILKSSSMSTIFLNKDLMVVEKITAN